MERWKRSEKVIALLTLTDGESTGHDSRLVRRSEVGKVR